MRIKMVLEKKNGRTVNVYCEYDKWLEVLTMYNDLGWRLKEIMGA